ncbi:MAG: GNAT family N-acetyltransferase [Bacteroidia bacterium]
MSDEYTYVRVSDEHRKSLQYISHCAFKIPVKENYFLKKWNTDFTGHKNIGFIAFTKSGEPIAYYGVFPCFVEYNGEKFLASQSGDTMTHPDHAGKGLFTTLAKMTYQLAQEEGIEFVVGFPNDNSYPVLVKKLNFTHRENLKTYKVNVKTLPVAAFFKKFIRCFPIYKFYLDIIFSFIKSDKPFLESSLVEKNVVCILHDKAFFDYKSFQNNFLVKVGGINVWLKSDGWLLIGDIEKNESIDFKKFLSGLKKLAFITGHTKIVFSASENTFIDNLLKQNTIFEKGGYFCYLNLISKIPVENMKFTTADLDTF